MRTRLIVIAVCFGVIIAAIAIVAANWPQLPKRTIPPAVTYIPMGGQAVEVPKAGCLAPMIAELRKRPSWTIRIDDMRWTDYTSPDEDPRHASIFISGASSGATWRNDWLPQQTMPLTTEEIGDVMAAFELPCDVDESIPNTGAYEGRYINIAYGKTEKAAAKLDYHAPITMRLGELFEAIKRRYITNRAGATKQFVLKLSGMRRTGEKEWTPYAMTIDGASYDNEGLRVMFVDWLLGQPPTRPKGRMTATGTLTMHGVTRPLAINLDRRAEENRSVDQFELAPELRMWMSINSP
ncbi:MAG: YceI family protein [Myxococcota bacterium]|nr:YceI family protein [Deltaproteobacteria bacterium]MDQ3339958.1 YceI family protein [Myxococcota bacterium]